MKTNKIMFIILVSIFVIISYISYCDIKNITMYRNKDAFSISLASTYNGTITKYDDLRNCDSFNFEEIDPNGVRYDDWKNSSEVYGLSLADSCDAYKNNIPLSYDYYTVFYNLYSYSRITTYLFVYIIGLVVFFSLYWLNKLLRSKFLFYYVQRKKYSSFIIKNILKSYSFVLPIVIFFLILYIIARSYSNHLDTSFFALSYATFNIRFYGSKFFLGLFCIQNCLMCLTFINVGLVFLKNNKLIFTIIETYIVYFLSCMLIEEFNLVPFTILYTGKAVGINEAVLWNLLYFGVSLVMVILSYKNKEDVLMKLDRSK